jgi:hypothetical protein
MAPHTGMPAPPPGATMPPPPGPIPTEMPVPPGKKHFNLNLEKNKSSAKT